MLKHCFMLVFAIVLLVALKTETLGQAEQYLKQGSSYHVADDTSDRAADLYGQLIMKYPKSTEAETAQFSLGSYYSRKFFILEARNSVQDWDSFNKAEEALYRYIKTYPRGYYLADAYQTLAMIALRRGYRDAAFSLWRQMKEAAAADQKVYISKVTWSTADDDVVKRYCDSASLADAAYHIAAKQSFNDAVRSLTKWAQANCH